MRIMRNVNHTFKMSAHVLENERTQFNEFIRNSVWKAKEEELENLEKENLKTIEEVHSALSSDKKIQAQIEKIKTHPWVKVMEGER